jgi:hypothetical protein
MARHRLCLSGGGSSWYIWHLLWSMHTRPREEISCCCSLLAVASRSYRTKSDHRCAPWGRCGAGTCGMRHLVAIYSQPGLPYVLYFGINRRFGRSGHLPVNGMRSHATLSGPPKCGFFPRGPYRPVGTKGVALIEISKVCPAVTRAPPGMQNMSTWASTRKQSPCWPQSLTSQPDTGGYQGTSTSQLVGSVVSGWTSSFRTAYLRPPALGLPPPSWRKPMPVLPLLKAALRLQQTAEGKKPLTRRTLATTRVWGSFGSAEIVAEGTAHTTTK